MDEDTVTAVPGLPGHTVARPGDLLRIGGTAIAVIGGTHAAVYGDVPGCTTRRTWSTTGRSCTRVTPSSSPGPTWTSSRSRWTARGSSWPAVYYVRAVRPRVAVPVHEGETTDPAKYAGMLAAFSPEGVVQPLPPSEVVSL